jgi:hypothetical protein
MRMTHIQVLRPKYPSVKSFPKQHEIGTPLRTHLTSITNPLKGDSKTKGIQCDIPTQLCADLGCALQCVVALSVYNDGDIITKFCFRSTKPNPALSLELQQTMKTKQVEQIQGPMDHTLVLYIIGTHLFYSESWKKL